MPGGFRRGAAVRLRWAGCCGRRTLAVVMPLGRARGPSDKRSHRDTPHEPVHRRRPARRHADGRRRHRPAAGNGHRLGHGCIEGELSTQSGIKALLADEKARAILAKYVPAAPAVVECFASGQAEGMAPGETPLAVIAENPMAADNGLSPENMAMIAEELAALYMRIA